MAADAAWRVTGFMLRVSSCFFLFGLCRGQLENRVLETALVSLCSTRENHEGGEYDIIILARVQADVLSTTQHRQNSGRFCESRGLVST